MAKVLVVDDVVENITLLKDSLKSKYEVIAAKSGHKALELLKHKILPDLILLDIVMPDMDGFEVCKIIKSNPRTQDIPIIFLTVLDKTHEVLEGFSVGGVDYITKPFEPSILHARIETHLTLSKQKKELEEYNRNLEKIISKKTQKIKEQYITDYLTRLHNRVYLDQLIESKKRQTIILLNIDNFHLINQNLSYYIGDKILVEVANRLREYQNDLFELCRLQGDEFVFLAQGNHIELAKTIVESIREYFANHAIEVEGIELDVTFTIAVDYVEPSELLKSVSITIQSLRESGKNQVGVQMCNDAFNEQQKNNLYWIKKVKESIKKEQIEVFFQPIKNLKCNKITRYEALVRIILENNEIILPDKFIKPSILGGVVTDISRIVIDKALKHIQNQEIQISINITQDDFRELYLLEYLESKRKVYGVKSSQIILEILESISINTESHFIEQLNELKEYGYKIAIDDFGTEMSNFSRLLAIKPDYIKIDGSFIKNIDKDDKVHEIVRTIVAFAHKLEAKVIAEFVHSEKVCHRVRELDVDYVQGYYIGKPSPTLTLLKQ